MLVSLCMIAYNESNALSGLFRDIALQDYPHDKIEVVFVDSMSTDDTKEKMEKFRDTDYGFWNVSVVQCVKRNQATSWNAALMTAKGDVIIRVDAHARIPRNFVSRNVYNIKQGENVVGGGRPNITSMFQAGSLPCLRLRILCLAVRLLRTDGRLRKRNILTAFFMRLTAERLLPRSADLTKISAEPRIMNFTTALEWRATRCAVAPILFRISIHETTFTE